MRVIQGAVESLSYTPSLSQVTCCWFVVGVSHVVDTGAAFTFEYSGLYFNTSLIVGLIC